MGVWGSGHHSTTPPPHELTNSPTRPHTPTPPPFPPPPPRRGGGHSMAPRRGRLLPGVDRHGALEPGWFRLVDHELRARWALVELRRAGEPAPRPGSAG